MNTTTRSTMERLLGSIHQVRPLGSKVGTHFGGIAMYLAPSKADQPVLTISADDTDLIVRTFSGYMVTSESRFSEGTPFAAVDAFVRAVAR